jgi:hypothetical protein
VQLRKGFNGLSVYLSPIFLDVYIPKKAVTEDSTFQEFHNIEGRADYLDISDNSTLASVQRW